MVKIKAKSAPLSSDSNVEAPVFHFSEFRPNVPLSNDGRVIDFVTDGKSLYVCAVNGFVTRATIEETSMAGGLLKIVSQGDRGKDGRPGLDGAAGAVPEIGAEYFDLGGEKKLALTVGGKRKAMTGDLTPPVYVPVVDDKENPRYLSWEWTNNDPPVVDLMKLRPLHERPILLRTNSDNTKREAESNGPANFIQWKYEGDEYWTNLISIQELMNLAFAGMATWEASDGKWHFGYKEVLKATYDSNKSGRRIINRVELGDILFDAGELPFEDKSGELQLQIDLITVELANIKAGLVNSVSVDGGLPNTPDSNGNVNLPLNLDQYAKKSEIPEAVDAYTKAQSDAKYQPKGNYVKGVKVGADGEVNTPDNNGVVTITLGDLDLTDYVKKEDLVKINNHFLYKPAGSDFNIDGSSVVGLKDIEFRVSSNKLQFRKQGSDDSWSNWTDIMTISGSGEGGEHVELKIENGTLYVKYDNGSWQEVGSVGDGSQGGYDPQAFIGVTLLNNVLTFTRRNGQNPVSITLPSGGSPSGEGCEYCWTEADINALIAVALQGYSKVTVVPRLSTGVRIATITVNGTSFDLYAPTSGGGDEPIPIPGEDAITLDLTNEIDSVPVDKAGKTQATASFLTELHAFSGSSSEITFTAEDVTISMSPSIQGVSVVRDADDPHAFQINVNHNITLSENVKITFTLWANDASRLERSAVYTLVPLQISKSEMFYLEIDPDIIKVDKNGNYTSTTVSALPHWLLDGDPQNITGWDDPSKVNDNSVRHHVYYKIDDGQYTFYSSAVNITSAVDEVTFELRYYYNNNKVDYIVMDGPEHVLIMRDGQDGGDGQPGPTGPAGDTYEKVYGLSDASLPASRLINENDTYDNKTKADDGYLPNFVFDGVSVRATATPQGVSADHRYEFESVRRKHNGVWGAFSAPALHSNFVAAGLTPEELEELKHDVEDAISDDLTAAQRRLGDAEARLDAIDGEHSTFLQDNASSLVAILTEYEDQDHTSFADMIIDGAQGSIETIAAAKTAEGLSTVQTDVNAMKGIIGNYADYEDGQGNISTVKSLLDSKASSAEISATYATKQSVTDARTEWNAAAGELESSVAKATYVWVEYDTNGDIVDVYDYDPDDYPSNPPSPSAQGNSVEREVAAEAMSMIRQKINEVDILANEGPSWAQIIAKASAETGSDIILDADRINLSGTTTASTAVIGNATITDATITDGTITDATITDCTINSSLQSANYSGTNHTGFMFDPVNSEFAIYGGQNGETRFDSTNGLQVPAANITGQLTANQIDATNLHVNSANIDGEIHATVGSFDYLTVDGEPISADNSLDIAFGDSSTSTTARYTLYFLY